MNMLCMHTKDIKLKFSAFFSSVEVTKCVNFQIPRLMGFKVGIFRIALLFGPFQCVTCGSLYIMFVVDVEFGAFFANFCACR